MKPRADIERVLVDIKGTAVTLDVAEKLGIIPEIFFYQGKDYNIRATHSLRPVAHAKWMNNWTEFYDVKEDKVYPISEYYKYTEKKEK
jgi:hypothetical protein